MKPFGKLYALVSVLFVLTSINAFADQQNFTSLFDVAVCSEGTPISFNSIEINALPTPTVPFSTSGTNISVNWTSVASATGYTLYFAPNPFTGPDSIQHVDMGMETSISVNLWDGASYYIAVTAKNEDGESGYSNIQLFTIE